MENLLISFKYLVRYGALPRVIAEDIYKTSFRDLGGIRIVLFYWIINNIITIIL